jgi:catechol 2,3-dioxygenase-like lactoylglutathione lyase family enzyme
LAAAPGFDPGKEPVMSDAISPYKLSHVGIRTARFAEVRDWYRTVLQARVVFDNGKIAVLAYDDEHHRVAVINGPRLTDRPDDVAAVDHIAFTYQALEGLMATYARLKARGIVPWRAINHGPTVSLYYRDPDRTQVELQIDVFATVDEANEFLMSDIFAENPVGVPFDPDRMVELLADGVPVAELKRQGAAQGHNLVGTSLVKEDFANVPVRAWKAD